GDIAPKSIVVESADLISQWGRQYSRARRGERPGSFRGSYRRHATKRISWEQGRSIRFRRKPVGPDKLARRGRSDGLVEVRLADSTPRSGEPATWGSGQQKMNCSRGNMGSMQREIRASMQREDEPTMETGLERIAAKATSEPKLWFTSLAHHITRERVWTNLCQIPKRSAPGVDGQTVTETKETFGEWVEPV